MPFISMYSQHCFCLSLVFLLMNAYCNIELAHSTRKEIKTYIIKKTTLLYHLFGKNVMLRTLNDTSKVAKMRNPERVLFYAPNCTRYSVTLNQADTQKKKR